MMQALIARRGGRFSRAKPNALRLHVDVCELCGCVDAVEHLHEVLEKELWNRKKFLAKKAVT